MGGQNVQSAPNLELDIAADNTGGFRNAQIKKQVEHDKKAKNLADNMLRMHLNSEGAEMAMMQEQIDEVEKEDAEQGGFLKRRLVVGSLTAKAKNAVNNVQVKNLPTFLDIENNE